MISQQYSVSLSQGLNHLQRQFIGTAGDIGSYLNRVPDHLGGFLQDHRDASAGYRESTDVVAVHVNDRAYISSLLVDPGMQLLFSRRNALPLYPLSVQTK